MFALLLAAWSMPADDLLNKEGKRFQGTWVLVYVEKDGQPIPQEDLDDLQHIELVVRGGRVTLKEDGQVKEGWHITCKIDPVRSPPTIDITVSLDDAKPKMSLGIYRFVGETLQVCVIEPSKEPERPTAFTTKPGSRHLLWHFKRCEGKPRWTPCEPGLEQRRGRGVMLPGTADSRKSPGGFYRQGGAARW
jgi:uncharacterized protein (TIGR03067 family)